MKSDQHIYDDYPWIIAVADAGYRWLPLRMALREFDKMKADTLLMKGSGMLVRVQPLYLWYAWPADLLAARKLKGNYGGKLLQTMRQDILDGTCIYNERPWR